MLDARRHEVFFARYRPVPGGVQRVSEYEVGTPGRARRRARGVRRRTCCSRATASPRYATEFAALDHAELAGPEFAAPSAAALVELAAARVRARGVRARRATCIRCTFARATPRSSGTASRRRDARIEAPPEHASRWTIAPMRRRHLRVGAAHRAAGVPAPVEHVAVPVRARAALAPARTSWRAVGREVVGYAGLMMTLDDGARHHDRRRPGVAPAQDRHAPAARARARGDRARRDRASRSRCG